MTEAEIRSNIIIHVLGIVAFFIIGVVVVYLSLPITAGISGLVIGYYIGRLWDLIQMEAVKDE